MDRLHFSVSQPINLRYLAPDFEPLLLVAGVPKKLLEHLQLGSRLVDHVHLVSRHEQVEVAARVVSAHFELVFSNDVRRRAEHRIRCLLNF